MKIKRLKIKNFRSFKEAEINFGNINIITGFNNDNDSGNGAGKTAILEAIIFALYGSAPVNLNKLVKMGESSCSVTLDVEKNNKIYSIERHYPSKLRLRIDGEDKKLATQSLIQSYINDQFNDYDFFKKFRVFDKAKGVNVLEFGNVQLKKTLMSFLDDIFEIARQKLLDKKRERETYNVDKKVYSHHFSEKRLNILKEGLEQLETDMDYYKNEDEKIRTEFNKLISDIQSAKYLIKKIEKDKKLLSKDKCPLCKTDINGEKKDMLFAEFKADTEKFKKEIQKNESNNKSNYKEIQYYKDKTKKISNERWKIQKLTTALETCLKFKDYKFTDKDVLLYKEAIKTLDNFAGYYITCWIKDLEAIVNSFILKLDMKLQFDLEGGNLKLRINREGQLLDHDMLSSGEKVFLSCIFKLAILLNKNQTGLVLIDEGIDCLDPINIERLIEIIQEMPIQLVLISQHEQIKNSKLRSAISVIKKDGISQIKEKDERPIG